MRDTIIFVLCCTVIGLVIVLNSTIKNPDNILSMLIGAMAGSVSGYRLGKSKAEKS